MCDCIEKINEMLANGGTNTVIDVPFIMDSDLNVDSKRNVMVVTAKADKSVRKKPTNLFASYCPFCGVKY